MKNPRMQIHPYISFNGNCEEALTFYRNALGGELSVVRYEGSPMAQGLAPEAKQKVMHASLVTDGGTIMASDPLPGYQRDRGNNIALSISLDGEDDADAIFERLSADGTVTMPLERQFWGAKFGMFVDKYGISWMVNCDQNSQSS